MILTEKIKLYSNEDDFILRNSFGQQREKNSTCIQNKLSEIRKSILAIIIWR